jgi:predicted RNA-binding protein Jag
MNKDHFATGVTAAAVMRELNIHLVTEQPKGCVLGWDGHTLQAVEPLLKIKNKHGFKLTVKIHQHRIRMAPLQRIFEAFRPIV